jgi:3-methyladenine DNA glycosylase/8-oxoguanine DNA glycosylase
MKVPVPFDLDRVVRSHGWYDLAPWSWDPTRRTLARPLLLSTGRVVQVDVAEAGPAQLALRVKGRGRVAAGETAEIRRALRASLALDEDLAPFRARALEIEGSRGPRPVLSALDRGLGRLLRSPTVFEDAVKTLCTTNCSWSLTRSMVSRLVEEIGEEGPAGRAFPSAQAMASRSERFFRDRVRAGYRAIDAADLQRRIRALLGFGPYATEHLMRLLGRHQGLALDSWTRRKVAELRGRRRPPADATFGKWFAPWGEWAGLAMWLEATADWHGDAPAAP